MRSVATQSQAWARGGETPRPVDDTLTAELDEQSDLADAVGFTNLLLRDARAADGLLMVEAVPQIDRALADAKQACAEFGYEMLLPRE